MIETILYFPLAFATFFIYFLPGFLISRFFKKFNGLEQLVIGFLLSTLIFFAIGLTVHLAGLLWSPFTLLTPAVALIIALLIIKRDFRLNKEVKMLLAIFILQFAINLLILPNIDFFPLGGDWKESYYTAKTFLSRDWELSEDRTFLYNFILGFFMSIFQQEYWYAQVVSVLISSLFLLPLYLIGLKFFSKRIAILSFFILSVSPFVHWTLYTWSKSFSIFFILIVYYFVMKRKMNIFTGISAALAFLVHPFSLLYLIPAGVLILRKRKEFKLNYKLALLVSLPIIVTLASWYIYNTVTDSMTVGVFKYFPIAVKGYLPLYEKSEQEILRDFMGTPIYNIFFVRVVNAAIPTVPLLFIVTKAASLLSPILIPLHKTIDFAQVPWTYHHLLTFPGQISLLLYVFAVIGVFKLLKERSKIKDLLFLMVGSFLLILVLYGWIVPFGANAGLPFSPLLALIGFWKVENNMNKDRWILLIFALAILESIIFSYWLGLHIEFTRQVLIQSGTINEYDKILTAYKLFR